MKAGLYIMNYHNVSWEDSFFTRSIYGTLRPDVFRDHLDWYQNQGDLISTPEALVRLRTGERFARPTFCLWFDDGFAGVRQHALPICRSFGIAAAQSLNSRFVQREEMFYLAKISFLAKTDGLRFLRSRLRKQYPDMPLKFRGWIKQVFNPELVKVIDDVYRQFTTAGFRNDAFRLYEDEVGNKHLVDEGWLMTNHSANHYPISEHIDQGEVLAEFEECARLIRAYHEADLYWVSPFSFVHPRHMNVIKQRAVLVQVANRMNTTETYRSRVIYRFEPGMLRSPEVLS